MYDNIFYTRYAVAIIIKFQQALYCEIVESHTHMHVIVNEVSLGISMVLTNTEKPR